MNGHDFLERFWTDANSGQVSRLELLREYAGTVIGPCEDAVMVREYSKVAQAHQRTMMCFVCGWSSRAIRLIWHHVIQVQHGGSASLWNQVRICDDCHAKVHPWLPKAACKGWASTLDGQRTERGQ